MTSDQRKALSGIYFFNDETVLQAPVISGLALSSSTIRVTIAYVANATSLQMQYKTVGGVYANFGGSSVVTPKDLTGLSAVTPYVIKVVASNAIGESQDSNEITVTTQAAAPILTTIENQIRTLVESMTTAGGYNYNWSKADAVVDAAPDANIYPFAEVNLMPDETNIDPDGPDASAYVNEANFEIIAHGAMSSESDTPLESFREVANKLLDDLKRLFGINYQLVADAAHKIEYISSNRVTEDEKQNSQLECYRLRTVWKITYSQRRDNPSVCVS